MLASPVEQIHSIAPIWEKVKRDAVELPKAAGKPKEIIPEKKVIVEKQTKTTLEILEENEWKSLGLDPNMEEKLTAEHLLHTIEHGQHTLDVYKLIEVENAPETEEQAFEIFTNWLKKENTSYDRRLSSHQSTESAIKSYAGRRALSVVKYITWLNENTPRELAEEASSKILFVSGVIWGLEYQIKHQNDRESNNHAGAAGIVGLLVENLVDNNDDESFWNEMKEYMPKDEEFRTAFENLKRGVECEVITYEMLSNSMYLKNEGITVRLGSRTEDANRGTDIVLSRDGKDLIFIDVKSSASLQIVGFKSQEGTIKTMRTDTEEEVDLNILLTPKTLVKYITEKGGMGISIRVPHTLTTENSNEHDMEMLTAQAENMIRALLESRKESNED